AGESGSPAFEVTTAAGVVRDIGTKFGLEVSSDGGAEVHVRLGAVEIDRGNGAAPVRVNSGEAARWRKTGDIESPDFDPGRFLQAVAWERVVFNDDFERSEGDELAGRRPSTGRRWEVVGESNPTLIHRGVLDTSRGKRVML